MENSSKKQTFAELFASSPLSNQSRDYLVLLGKLYDFSSLYLYLVNRDCEDKNNSNFMEGFDIIKDEIMSLFSSHILLSIQQKGEI